MYALADTSPDQPHDRATNPMERIDALQAKLQTLRYRSYNSEIQEAARAYELAANSYELLVTALKRELGLLGKESRGN